MISDDIFQLAIVNLVGLDHSFVKIESNCFFLPLLVLTLIITIVIKYYYKDSEKLICFQSFPVEFL